VIVRWGLDELAPVLAEVGSTRPLLITSTRFAAADVPVERRFTGVRPHTPADSVAAAVQQALDADAVVPLGGGSAIDTAKAVSAQTGLPVVSVPTTYSGAEWTAFFGTRDEERRVKGGGSGAQLAAVVYEPRLTLDLPRSETGGTAMNALAHAAEALYTTTRDPAGDEPALAGAGLIAEFLPQVLDAPHDLGARTQLLAGAANAGEALGKSFMGLAHAAAQALGGRYGLPHGAMNALVLAPTLRFNEPVAREALDRLGERLGEDPAAASERLARLAGFERLRDFDVPEVELPEVAEAAVVRPAARANPRQATAEEVTELLRTVW
jgi:alcohol dehydrogenase class IV